MKKQPAISFLSFRRLRIQIIVIASVSLILALGGFTGLILSQQETRLLKLADDEARSLTQNIAGTITEWVVNDDYDRLSEALLRSAEFSSVKSIKVINEGGMPLSFVTKNDEDEIKESFSLTISQLPSTDVFTQKRNKYIIQNWAPVMAEETIGWVFLEFSLDEINILKTQVWHGALSVVGIFLSVSIFVFWKFTSKPLKAIERITEYSAGLADLTDQNLPVDKCSWETEKLSITLNATAEKLRDNWNEIKEARDQLELRVERRTAALAKAVENLEHEIAERKRVEVELLHAQKMESVGQLAAGVAHEINTPIQFVSDNLRFLEDSQKDLFKITEEIQELLSELKEQNVRVGHLDKIEKSIKESDLEFLQEEFPLAITQSLEGTTRVAKIVQAMKDFSHPCTSEMEKTDINKMIESTATLSKNEWKYVSTISFDLQEDLPPVDCYPGELSQVILNLIVNGAHAIESIRKDDGDPLGKITLSSKLLKNKLQITVKDTGSGIPQEIQEKVFDPFFTTKQVGKGTGQGLAISYDVVVNKHKGELYFTSEENKGTTFVINIPVKTSHI